MAVIQRLESEHAGVVAQVGLTAALDDVRWQIEELRVQQFAQQLGTNGSVSAQRIRRSLDRIRAPAERRPGIGLAGLRGAAAHRASYVAGDSSGRRQDAGMAVWFEGENEIGCDIARVSTSFDQLGAHYVGVVSLMPGLVGVELVDESPDSVTIRTNEGMMTRTGIQRRTEPGRVVVEFDEEYQAGSKVTTKSHFVDEFTAAAGGVRHRVIVSDVSAPGLLGFLYRRFGRKRMGKAFLASYKAYLEG